MAEGRAQTAIWEDAPEEERRRLALLGYRFYDGCPTPGGNELTAADVFTSLGINSRIAPFDAARFLIRSDEARVLLAKIPDDARLEDAADEQILAAAQLIDLFREAREIDIAKATKVLYLKRPAFIPVIDSIVGDFLLKNFPHKLHGSSSPLADLRFYQELLLARARPLEEIRTALAAQGMVFSAARILSHLIWLGWNGAPWLPRGPAFFGQRIIDVWDAPNLGEARLRAAQTWKEDADLLGSGHPLGAENVLTSRSRPHHIDDAAAPHAGGVATRADRESRTNVVEFAGAMSRFGRVSSPPGRQGL